MVMAWEEPPPVRHTRRYRWDDVKSELRSKPGVWAKIAVVESKNEATTIYGSFRYHGFESCQRSQGDGTFAVYARYLEEAADA